MSITELPPMEELDEPAPIDEEPRPAEHYCPDCERAFQTAGGLKRHRTVSHGATDRAPRTAKQLRPPLKPALKNTLDVVSFALMFVNQVDANIVAAQSDNLAEAWAKLAQRNAKVDRVLRSLTNATEYGEVIAATLAVALPIMANHGLMPEQFAAMMQASTMQHDDTTA